MKIYGLDETDRHIMIVKKTGFFLVYLRYFEGGFRHAAALFCLEVASRSNRFSSQFARRSVADI